MKLTIARHAGFCFGVRRAIDLTFKIRQKYPGARIFTVGPIIHNPQVIDALERRGIGIITDLDDPRLREGDIAIIRAHGISPDDKAHLTGRGVRVIDATCPMVLKVHAIIKRAARTADTIVIVGDKDHPEMEAHLGVAGAKGVQIEDVAGARALESVGRMAVVAQTTFDVALFKEIVEVLGDKAEVLDVSDTICRSTVDRQQEVAELARTHDTLIVIGGRNSANTARLAEIGVGKGRNVVKVETADQLDGLDTATMDRVAIIAGASTPQWIIEECIERLKSLDTAGGMRTAMLRIATHTPLFLALGGVGLAMASLVFAGQTYRWDVLGAVLALVWATAMGVRGTARWTGWTVATAVATALAFVGAGRFGAVLVFGVALLKMLLDRGDAQAVVQSVYGALIFCLAAVLVPLGLVHAAPTPAVVLLGLYAVLLFLGGEILIGLKNMEHDAIMGRMSMARLLSEERATLIMEYAIMGLALLMFVSFPLKITPALAYGLLPSLFFLAKGIDFYTDHIIFDNLLFMLYVQSVWLILPIMGLLWLVTMM